MERPDNLSMDQDPTFSDDEDKPSKTEIIDLKAEAKKLTEKGLVCVPLRVGFKYPDYDEWEQLKKTPLARFTKERKGFGIVCGEASGVFCVDIDDVPQWTSMIDAIDGNDEDLDETPAVKTPSGGYHYYFKYDPEIKTGKGVVKVEGIKSSSIDVRSQGGQVVAPPSLYFADKKKPWKKKFEGTRYKWITSFDDCEPKECPEWLKHLLLNKFKLQQNPDGSIALCEPPKPKLDENGDEEPDIGEFIDRCAQMGDSGEYEYAGIKRKLSADQVAQIVYGLRTERFSGYDEWCKLLWAVARWQNENEADEEATITMLDEYSQLCDNYTDRRSVEKKYNEAFKRAGKSSKVSIGTLIHWLKEDNPLELARVFKTAKDDAKAERVIPTTFDRRDPYVWNDFVREMTAEIFETMADVEERIMNKMPKVLANVQMGEGFFVKKDDCDGNIFNYVKTITSTMDFNIRYGTKDKKGKPCVHTISFKSFVRDSTDLPRFANVICHADESKPCPRDHFNIWEGFKAERVEEVDEAKLAPIIYILRELWASGDEQLYRYILAWFRFTLARPAELIGVALFLYGEQGSGKGCILDFFEKFVIGQSFARFCGVEELLEKHQTNLKGKRLVYINEMGSTKDQFINNFDKIKAKITDPTLMENPKGLKIMKIDNIMNVVMSTNHKNALHLSETDRRYTCLEVSSAKCGPENKPWWEEQYPLIHTQETANHFYTWLLDMDEKSLPNPRTIYQTKLRQEIIRISRDNVELFLEEFPAVYYERDENATDEIRAQDLYEEYVRWCGDNREHAKSSRLFWLKAGSKLQKRHAMTGNVYRIVKPPPTPDSEANVR